jgi:hypothetical protein
MVLEQCRTTCLWSWVLKHVDTTQKFWMETNASNYTYDTILSQKADDGMYHPVTFSKSMNPARTELWHLW